MKHLPNSILAMILTAALLAGATGCGGGGSGGGGDPPPNPAKFAYEEMSPDTIKDGDLSDTDEALPDGRHIDLYLVTLPEAGTLTLKMTSTSVDAYLYIFKGSAINEEDMNLWGSAAYLLAEDDDSAVGVNTTDASIGVDLPAGSYLIGTTSSFPEETGSYNLRSSFVPLGAIVDLAPNDNICTSLTDSDIKYPDSEGTFADRYTVTLSVGGTLEVDMVSEIFDSYLYLYTIDGLETPLWAPSHYIDENDGFEEDDFWNAYLTIPLEAGEYVIVATSYFEGDTGVYDLATRFTPTP